MEQLTSVTSGRAGDAVEVGLATRTAPETAVLDVTTAPRRARLTSPRAETTTVMARGVTFVHQRFHEPSPQAPPAALLQHFPAETGRWDPTTPRRASHGRELILMQDLDRVADADADVRRLADESLDFIDELGLAEVDLLGFSLGIRPPDDDIVLLSPRLVEQLVSMSQRAG